MFEKRLIDANELHERLCDNDHSNLLPLNFLCEIINDCPTIELDRDTALAILKDFSNAMYPSYDLFGNKTLVINRDKFEAIRKKYLD